MTKEKALEVSNLIFKIERYESLLEEVTNVSSFRELIEVFGDTDIEDEVAAVIKRKIDSFLKELEEM